MSEVPKQRSLKAAARAGAKKPPIANDPPVPPCPVDLHTPAKAAGVAQNASKPPKAAQPPPKPPERSEGPQKGRKRRKRTAGELKREQQAHDSAQRLPDGSRFNMVYHGATQTWSGELTVVDFAAPGTPLVIAGTAGGLFRLCQSLDRQFRETLAKSASSEAPAAPAKEAAS